MGKYSVKSASRIVKNDATRMSKRLTFNAALKAGSNVTQASELAGVTRQTGAKWKTSMQEGTFTYSDSASAILTKDKSVEILSQIAISEDESGAYRIKAIDLCAELQGTKAPARSVVETRIVPTDVIAWLDGMNIHAPSDKALCEPADVPMLPADSTHALPPGNPNDGVIGDVSSPHKLSTNSDKAETDSDVTVEVIAVKDRPEIWPADVIDVSEDEDKEKV